MVDVIEKRLQVYLLIQFFFFSSRRRHTRSLRDWSSDVCSSDLIGMEVAALGDRLVCVRPMISGQSETTKIRGRSEERRVGKECRSRLWPDHYKENNRH